ncbi:hypothetical protein HK097_011694 [Rhizophlyctis rosea]|uniref:Translation machinery-associated protein 16 n=1 Tax=Rhizophlyctis rosea TaxID=64517 RepID=A0AAD5S7T3_9FUNG|nr:hypothetical protein HK097_011694 [Rhizophlyctis rosea]
MPNNKIHNIKKIKDLDKAHPYSRKATQARRALNRGEAIEKKASARNVERTRRVERTLWFKFAVPEDCTVAGVDMVHDIIRQYIGRNDDEIEKLRSTLRKNRPRPARLDLLETLRAKDLQEYATSGIELPILTDAKNLERLKTWEGDYNNMDTIKVVRVRDPIKVLEDLERKQAAAEASKEKTAAKMDVEGTAARLAEETGMDVDA